MEAEKRPIQVQTQDKALKPHAATIDNLLKSPKVAVELSTRYPGIASISLTKGKSFNVQGYDPKSHTLRLSVNIGSSKVTAQQLSKYLQKQSSKKEPVTDTGVPAIMGFTPLEPSKLTGIRLKEISEFTGIPLKDIKREFKTWKSMIPEQLLTKITGGSPGMASAGLLNLPFDLLGSEKPMTSRLQLGEPVWETSRPGMTKPLVKKDEKNEADYEYPRKVQWPDVDVPEGVLRELGYSDGFTVPERSLLRKHYETYFAGSFLDSEGNVVITNAGKPLHNLEEVNLFYVKGNPNIMAQTVGYPFKVWDNAEKIVIPMVGDFYGKDGVITKDLEDRGIIERVKDKEGKPVTAAYFVKTMRQLYQITTGKIRIFKIGGRKIIPNSPEAVEEAWGLVSPACLELLHQLTEMSLARAYKMGGITGPFDEFADKYRRKVTLQVGISLPNIKKIKDDIAEKQGAPAADEQIKLDLSRFEVLALPVCGIGIKGPGCMKYDGNHIYLKDDGGVELPPHCRLIKKDVNTAFIVDKRFENKKGLMLAIPHQPWSRLPVGGTTIYGLLSFGRENELLKHGAELSYITTAVIPLLSREQVPEQCTEQTAIVTNFVLDDSRRIGDLLDENYPLEAHQGAYKAMVVEKYIKDKPASEGEVVEFVEKHFETARDIHWTRLCQRVGKNMKAVFNAGFTNPHDQNLIGNISFDGGLCDVVDLARMRHPREFHSTISEILDGLSLVYKVAGHKPTDFFKSRHFKILLAESLGEKEADRLAKRINSFIEPGDPDKHHVKTAKAIGLVTDAFLRTKQVTEKSVWGMDDGEFIDLLESDKSLRKRVNLTTTSVREFKKHLETGIPLYGTTGGMWIRITEMHDELERYKVPADFHLRAETAMSMQENFAELKREYEQKFAA